MLYDRFNSSDNHLKPISILSVRLSLVATNVYMFKYSGTLSLYSFQKLYVNCIKIFNDRSFAAIQLYIFYLANYSVEFQPNHNEASLNKTVSSA